MMCESIDVYLKNGIGIVMETIVTKNSNSQNFNHTFLKINIVHVNIRVWVTGDPEMRYGE